MTNLQDLTTWAVPRLSSLLPLPEDELRQVVSYAATSPELSSPSAIAAHFTDLLGASPECLSFIEEFSRRRFPAAPAASQPRQPQPPRNDLDAPPRSNRKGPKKKEPLGKLPPVRRVDNSFSSSADDVSTKVYRKEDLEDYMSTSRHKTSTSSLAPPTLASTSQPSSRSSTPNPAAAAASLSSTSSPRASSSNLSQKQPAQQGTLTSDLLNSKKKTSKSKSTTVVIPAGPTMRPPSSTISDVSSALRSLELQTNPSLATSHTIPAEKRRCNCAGSRHELLLAAPNCLHCGKIICIKEGLAPCTFCGHDLISPEEMDSMRRILRDEQSKEKMNAHNAGQKKSETTKITAVYASKVNPSAGGMAAHKSGPTPAASSALNIAMEQRDKLLGFQSTSAKRTKIIDQAADWETPEVGLNAWATPQERALQLREQQKKMRELEWDTKDEWEKRTVVVSIDLKGKRVEKTMRSVERPRFEVERDVKGGGDEEEEGGPAVGGPERGARGEGGTFSQNPLLTKGLIKPIWRPESGDASGQSEQEAAFGEWDKVLRGGWRRVQDDMTNNEVMILDGGRLGTSADNVEKSTEPPCG
ncbi:hypothetical protein DRE_02601 [Drechslerella stenobrocha 248]|uniref:TRIP4/RQT4 C2HC5-type zinc finger domain-containing protein n=1 Tax=Drechslerella stenobrocha 248 TaxID=1043628 RepID=W7I7E6_9PEZI|nr:hypothetical protein DRE_02601 [Drechslerella stenobrocha 248]